jgi:hypothetical protein
VCAGGGCGWRQLRGTLTHYLSGRRVHLRRVTTPNGISRRSTGWWRAGVVLGIGIARARARTARHSAGYHSIDDAHAPLCMSNSLHAAHSTGLAAILGRAAILQVRTGNTRQKRQARLADATPPTSASHEAPILRSEPTAMFPMMSSWGSCPHTTTDVPCPIAHLHPHPLLRSRTACVLQLPVSSNRL